MFGGLGIACRTQEKLQRVAFRIDRAVEIHPGFFDVDGRLIDSPRIIAGFQVRPATFFQFWSISLDPAIHGRVIDAESTLSHHLFEVAIAERRAEVPAHTQKNDCGLEMTPFEGMLLAHDGPLCSSFPQLYKISFLLATQPLIVHPREKRGSSFF